MYEQTVRGGGETERRRRKHGGERRGKRRSRTWYSTNAMMIVPSFRAGGGHTRYDEYQTEVVLSA